MITSEQATQAKGIISSLDEDKKKLFLEKYNSLDAPKKEEAIGRLLSLASSESGLPREQDTSYISQVKRRGEEAQKDISGRGSIASNISDNFRSSSYLRKGLGALQVAGAPLTALQAGISNPSLQMQQGNFNPGRLLKESALGLTGQKLGEYGDVMSVAGAPKPIAATAGLILDVAGPIKVAKTVSKALGSISMMSDASLMKAGGDLTKAVESANTHVGTALGDAFKQVDGIKISNSDFTRNVSSLPKPLRQAVEEELGSLKNIDPTIGNLRRIRQIVGKFKPSAVGREERGLAENIEADKLNTIYGSMKSTITNYVSKAIGAGKASNLLALEDSAANVYRASDLVNKVDRKSVV